MAVEVERSKRPTSIVERNKQAALERQANIEKAKQEAAEAAEAERKNDGRIYDMEVEGFNIGDSLVRRAVAANERVAQLQQEQFEQDMESDDEEIESSTPVYQTQKIEVVPELDVEDEDDFDLDFVDLPAPEAEKISPALEQFVQEEPVEKEPEEVPEREPVQEAPKSIAQAYQEVMEKKAATEEPEEEEEEVTTSSESLMEVATPDIPMDQSELITPTEEFKDVTAEIEADVEGDTVQIEDERVSKEEMEKLKSAIKTKVVKLPDISNMAISNKPVSVNQVVASQTITKVVDWPLMESGKLITMRSFTGPEMDDLTRDLERETERNRANARRENLHMIYDHLTSKKLPFEQWLRNELADDYPSYEMAAMVASYSGANYIPMSCADQKCNNIWLSDDIPMMKHMKFNNDTAKERFNQILQSPDTVKGPSTIKRVPISNTIAIDVRTKLTFYNAFFENSILDAKFTAKYRKLLDLIMYIDNMYEIKSDGLHPVMYKRDPNSEVKTLKYRIASFAKIITNLTSDAYTRLYVEIRDALEDTSTDYITYVMPAMKCPKCGTIVEETEVGPRPYSLVLARHRLTQLTAKL